MLRDLNLDFSGEDHFHSSNKLYQDCLFIGDLFHHHLGNIKTGKCQKIVITAVNAIERQIEDYENASTIGLVRWFAVFDFEKFDKSERAGQKNQLLEFLYFNLTKLFEFKGWEAAGLETAFLNCKKDDIIFSWYLKTEKKIKSPADKDIFLKILFVWEWSRIDCIIVRFESKTGAELNRVHFFTTTPNVFEKRWDFIFDVPNGNFLLKSKKYDYTHSISISKIK
jgi:hypothetical protein